MVAAPGIPTPYPQTSANERMKHSFPTWFWGSIAAAAVLHFLVIALWPQMVIADISRPTRAELEILPPPALELPPPPAEFPRPSVPIVSANLNIDPDLTIAEQPDLFRAPTELPAPPIRGEGVADEPRFTPRTVEPRLGDSQRSALMRHLERNYPATLRDAGIAGRVVLWVFINEQGQVQNTRVVETSGYPAFDQLAQEALRTVTFSPAMNRDQRVGVWIQLPISFQVR